MGELLPLTTSVIAETVLDERARRSLKVGADVVRVEWAALDATLATIHGALRSGVRSRLTAHLHDVLLYRPGDFFVKHRDSLKSPRHLLTMSVIVALSGCGEATGEVQFPTLSTTWQGRAGGNWCAWYTSEEHAVAPLTGDGHRVVATYIVEELPVTAEEVDGERTMEPRTGTAAAPARTHACVVSRRLIARDLPLPARQGLRGLTAHGMPAIRFTPRVPYVGRRLPTQNAAQTGQLHPVPEAHLLTSRVPRDSCVCNDGQRFREWGTKRHDADVAT